VSGNALLYGGELLFDIHPHPLDWLHFENSLSFVEGIQLRQPDSMSHLPFMPAPKYQSQLKADFKSRLGFFKNTYLKVELDYYFAQNKIHSAYSTETQTPHYYLINAGVGSDIVLKKK
jgi:iron complex outermembrane receptor protein